MWAEPDLDQAAACLKRLSADGGLRAALGRRSIDKAERRFALERFCRDARAATGLDRLSVLRHR